MASIQLKSGKAPAKILDWPLTRVQIKAKWTDQWETAHYYQVMEVFEAAAPTIPYAKIRYRAGTIRREDGGAGVDTQLDQSNFSPETAKNLLGYYVRIQYLPTAVDTSTKPKNALTVFVGQVVDYATQYAGGDNADQVFTAMALEHILDKVMIAGSYFNNAGSATRIDRSVVFNERYTMGPSPLGNRSSAKIAKAQGSSKMSYVFDRGDATHPENSVWSALDILNYLLTFYAPDDFTITLAGTYDTLAALFPPKLSLDGDTLHAALCKIIDRRRGMGWTIVPKDKSDDGSSISFALTVYSVFDEAVVTSDGQKVLPNSDKRSLDQSKAGVEVLIEELTTNIDALNQIGTIIVEGEQIVSCFTLSVANGTIVKGWSDQEETTYLAGAGLDTQANAKKLNDIARKAEQLNRVFTTFTVPTNWNWKAGDGTTQGSAPYLVNPSVTFDGKLSTNVAGNIRPWGLTFLRHLPLLRPTTDDTGRATQEYTPPFVILKYTAPAAGSTPRYIFAHDPDGGTLASCHIRGLDTSLGLELAFAPSHRLAKNHWTNAKPTQTEPLYDWKDIIATVAVRTDTKLSVRETLKGRDAWRELRINVPGAELWWVAPRTVIDIDKDGNLVRFGTGFEKTNIVRDDSPHLRRVLALARAWYSKERRALTLTTKQFELDYPVGSYFTTFTKSSGVIVNVNSVVSSRKTDFESGQITVTTSYGELDFVGVREDLPALQG